jgi:hypothetical protein
MSRWHRAACGGARQFHAERTSTLRLSLIAELGKVDGEIAVVSLVASSEVSSLGTRPFPTPRNPTGGPSKRKPPLSAGALRGSVFGAAATFPTPCRSGLRLPLLWPLRQSQRRGRSDV